MEKKHILVLCGSPRKESNSTRMAESFGKGAQTKGHQVTYFDTSAKAIKGCTACDSCWSEDNPCVYRDDFDQLYPLMEKADVMVYATPLYWFTFPAPLKAAVDKMYAYAGDRPDRPLGIRECFLLVCAGDQDPDIFDGIIATFREIAHYMKWVDRGVLAVPGVHGTGDIEKTDAEQQAYEYGKNI